MKGRELANDATFKQTIEELLPALGLKFKKLPTDKDNPITSQKRKGFADQLLEYPQNLVNRFANAIVLDPDITDESSTEDISIVLNEMFDTLAGIEEGEK